MRLLIWVVRLGVLLVRVLWCRCVRLLRRLRRLLGRVVMVGLSRLHGCLHRRVGWVRCLRRSRLRRHGRVVMVGWNRLRRVHLRLRLRVGWGRFGHRRRQGLPLGVWAGLPVQRWGCNGVAVKVYQRRVLVLCLILMSCRGLQLIVWLGMWLGRRSQGWILRSELFGSRWRRVRIRRSGSLLSILMSVIRLVGIKAAAPLKV